MKKVINIVLGILSIVNIVYSIKLVIDTKLYWDFLIPAAILFGMSCIFAAICGLLDSDNHQQAKNVFSILSLVPIAIISSLFILLGLKLLILKPIFYIIMAILTLICIGINKSLD